MSYLKQSIEIRGGAVMQHNGRSHLVLPLPTNNDVRLQVDIHGEDDEALFTALLKAEKVVEATRELANE